MKQPLVSILMPAYNSVTYIKKSIDSVCKQSYTNWELLITEDGSDDGTKQVIESYKDPRIKYFWQNKAGAAAARNTSLENAKGQYIAFLDSDDIWYPDKLKLQIMFMKNGNYPISCTNYRKVDENGMEIKVIKCVEKADYNRVLLDCPVGNLTVIYDVEQLGRIYALNLKKRNDYALWLKILKKTKYIYGLDEVLADYTVRKQSLSYNKLSLVKYQWKLYRDIEKLSILRGLFHVAYFAYLKIFRIK